MTLKAIEVHLCANMRRDGAAYTALSRTPALKGLRIVVDPPTADPAYIFETAFKTSEAVLSFLELPDMR
jgi:hypothetical protein